MVRLGERGGLGRHAVPAAAMMLLAALGYGCWSRPMQGLEGGRWRSSGQIKEELFGHGERERWEVRLCLGIGEISLGFVN